MKRLNVMIILLLSLLAFWGVSVYSSKNKHDNNIDMIYVDRTSTVNEVCEFDSTYYYTGNQGIYSNNRCVLSTNGKPLIYTKNNTLFVYADKEITGYDKSLSPICKYSLSEEAAKFVVSDNEIFYIDTDDKFHVLDIATIKDKEAVETEIINDSIIVYHYTNFLICEDTDNSSISAFESNDVVTSAKEYSMRFVYLSDNCLIHTSAANTSTINLYKIDMYDQSNVNSIDLPIARPYG